MQANGNPIKKFKMKTLLNLLESNVDGNIETERTVDTNDVFENRVEAIRKRTNKTTKNSVKHSKNNSVFDDYKDSSILPSIVSN
jgi:hypothetical protein